jgi:transcriptional regulator with XRE-family HTH domain
MGMDLGERVRALRRQRGLTLAALAGDSLSVALVSKIERGLVTPSLNTLYYLAERLDIAAAGLLQEPDGAREGIGAVQVAAARAHLLLGDVLAASRHAAGAAQRELPLSVRARLAAVHAESLLAVGNAGEAAACLLQGSTLVADLAEAAAPSGGARPVQMATAELAWALGLLERRRGSRSAAQRAWARCLEALETAHPGDLWAQLLAARTQVELAALHEVEAALETAYQFLLRATPMLAWLADPAGSAQVVLAAADGTGASDGQDAAALAPLSGALALAITVAASRLAPQAARDLARLERGASRWPAAAAPAEISHSRHLR